MTPNEIFSAMKELLDDPKKWTKEALARDKSHWYIDPLKPEATCWCLSGAMLKVTGQHSNFGIQHPAWFYDAGFILRKVLDDNYLTWQDREDTTYQQVMDLLHYAMRVDQEEILRQRRSK